MVFGKLEIRHDSSTEPPQVPGVSSHPGLAEGHEIPFAMATSGYQFRR
jgi:hypothetical protein